MTVVINGTTGITSPGGDISAADDVINGLTVGKGGGAVSTNTAIGSGVLTATNTGGANTAVGQNALNVATSGANNTAVGTGAMLLNTTGSYNSAYGYYALSSNTSGQQNAAMSYSALSANTTGSFNTALGLAALNSNTTASNNTAVGYQAGYSNTTGGSNTAVGYNALQSNTTASNNTAVGYQAGYINVTGTYNTFLGFQAGYTSNAAVNNGSTCVGAGAGFSLTTGGFNTFIGPQGQVSNGSGGVITTGSKNTIIGAYNGNQSGLDIRTASNYIVLSDGDGNPQIYHNGSNFVSNAIYTTTTSNGANVFVYSGGALARSTSALKYKQDIRDLELIDITKFRPVRYKSKCENDDQTLDHFGVIADEVDQAGIKELVSYGAEGEVEGFQYERLTVVLLKAVQELKAEVDSLKQQLGK